MLPQCPLKPKDDTTYHGYEYGDRDHVIIPLEPGAPLIHLSDLSLHIARSHGFCGARGAYRIDPIRLANILGCGPDVFPTVPGLAATVSAELAGVKPPEVEDAGSPTTSEVDETPAAPQQGPKEAPSAGEPGAS